jgi:hypothetical protein
MRGTVGTSGERASTPDVRELTGFIFPWVPEPAFFLQILKIGMKEPG